MNATSPSFKYKPKSMNQIKEKSNLGQAAKRERHRILSNILESSTASFLQQYKFKNDLQGLHLDCKDGEVTLQLARMLGNVGSIVGVDNSENSIAIAKQRTGMGNEGNVAFSLRTSFEKTNTQKYDFVYSRFLLSTSSNPMKELQKMYRLLKPEGLLLIEDIDFSSNYCSPYNSAFERYSELYSKLMLKNGTDTSIGSNLHLKLENIGFQKVKTQLIPPVFLTGERKKLVSLTFEIVADSILKASMAKPAEIQALLYEIKDFEQQAFSMISLPGIYQVSGIKPFIQH